jgi:hypothetical protein
MNTNKFNIGDDVYTLCGLDIYKFKITQIELCKTRGTVDISGYLYQRDHKDGTLYLTDDEPIHTPESVCRKTIDELIDAVNKSHPIFNISLKETAKELLP